MFTAAKRRLASGLFDLGVVRFGAFRLKLHDRKPDTPLSPVYFDLRMLRSFPEVMNLAVEVYEELISGLKFDVYADVPTAATPIVAILSHRTGVPMISPRKEERQHGIHRSIDGAFTEGQVALLVDDLVTRAESKLETISVLEENELRVHDVAVLIDREQGGAEELRKRGYACHAAFKLRDLFKLYLDSGMISVEKYERTIAYLDAEDSPESPS